MEESSEYLRCVAMSGLGVSALRVRSASALLRCSSRAVSYLCVSSSIWESGESQSGKIKRKERTDGVLGILQVLARTDYVVLEACDHALCCLAIKTLVGAEGVLVDGGSVRGRGAESGGDRRVPRGWRGRWCGGEVRQESR